MSETRETSFWINFFIEAGILPSISTEYAMTFTDNRIKESMLMDLDKAYLKEMGITVLGDIIAILKHAKVFHCNKSRQTLIPTRIKKSPKSITNDIEPTKNNSVAVRMLEHYVRKEPTILKTSSSDRLNLPCKRPIEEEIEIPNKRNCVFKRLGDNIVSSTTKESPKIIVTMFGKSDKPPESPDSSKVSDDLCYTGKLQPKDILEYRGILKYSKNELENLKKHHFQRLQNSANLSITIGSENASSSGIRNRIGTPVTNSRSEGIFAQEFQVESFIPKVKKIVTPASKKDKREIMFSGESKRLIFKTQTPSPSILPDVRQTVIKKMIRVNKRTGQIIGESKKVVHSNLFSRNK